MKKILFTAVLSALCVCTALTSCKKSDPNEGSSSGGSNVSVSLVVEDEYDETGKAKLTVLLSAPASKTVTVNLADGKAAAGYAGLMPAKYTKKVSIPAGVSGKTQTITANPGGLASGTYQTVIKISSVSGGGAVVDKSASEVRLDYDYDFLPTLTYDSPVEPFGSKTGKTKLIFRLSEATSQDVRVTLEKDASSTINQLTFSKTFTIPAGSEKVELPLSTDVDVPYGSYKAVINITDVQNAKMPSRPTISIDFLRSDDAGIVIDGEYADWDAADGVETLTCPNNVYTQYADLRQVKVVADSRYIYFYIVCNGYRDSMPFDFFFDVDGNPGTGGFATTPEVYGTDNVQQLWSNMGCEWLLEQQGLYNPMLENVFDFTSNALSGWDYNYMHHYEGANGQNMYSDHSEHLIRKYEGDITKKMCYAQGQVADGGAPGVLVPDGCVFECSFSRKTLNMTGNKCRFGLKYMRGAGWPMHGMLPQGAYSGGARQLVDMYELSLPQFVDAY